MTVAYVQDWHPTNGTHYRQRVTVDRNEFRAINNVLRYEYNNAVKKAEKNHLITEPQMNILTYGKPLNEKESIHYLSNTQRNIMCANFPNKRYITGNTILVVRS